VDPFAVLGVSPEASEEEVAAAYRELAKEWHPDRVGAAGQGRMAEINVAYELLRAGEQQSHSPSRAPTGRRGRKGGSLSDAERRALGPELIEALGEGEEVRLVTPASTWTSPRTILVVTDRRLLWLLDDAPVARVRSINLRDVTEVASRARRPRRRVHTLSLRTTSGRRHSFAELRPHTAAAIERHLRAAARTPTSKDATGTD
jgi:curved DNA-binding protein CbpA